MSHVHFIQRHQTRIATGLLALISALSISLTTIAPTASAEGSCRAGWSIYDTGIPGAFKEDHNLNGLVCSKTKEISPGYYRNWYSDDR